MILECLPFASQGSLSCLPGNPDKTAVEIGVFEKLYVTELCARILCCLLSAYNRRWMHTTASHCQKWKGTCQNAIEVLRVGFLSTIYQLLRAEFDTCPKSGLKDSTFAIMRIDTNIKLHWQHSTAHTASHCKNRRVVLPWLRDPKIHKSKLHTNWFCGFPEPFLSQHPERPCLLEVLRPRLEACSISPTSASGEACRQENQNLTIIKE